MLQREGPVKLRAHLMGIQPLMKMGTTRNEKQFAVSSMVPLLTRDSDLKLCSPKKVAQNMAVW